MARLFDILRVFPAAARMEMREISVSLLAAIDLVERVVVVGVAREASRVLAAQRIDIATGTAASLSVSGPHPAGRCRRSSTGWSRSSRHRPRDGVRSGLE
jgi:hypothetical protein